MMPSSRFFVFVCVLFGYTNITSCIAQRESKVFTRPGSSDQNRLRLHRTVYSVIGSTFATRWKIGVRIFVHWFTSICFCYPLLPDDDEADADAAPPPPPPPSVVTSPSFRPRLCMSPSSTKNVFSTCCSCRWLLPAGRGHNHRQAHPSPSYLQCTEQIQGSQSLVLQVGTVRALYQPHQAKGE